MDQPLDRLAITIVYGTQAHDLVESLTEAGFSVTVVDAVGGFLHESLVTLLIGLPQSRLEFFYAEVRRLCPNRVRYVPMGVELMLTPGYPLVIEARIGGATVMLLSVEQYLTF